MLAARCTFWQYLALTCAICLLRALTPSLSFHLFADQLSDVCREAVNDVARCLARLDPDFSAAAAEELFIQGTTTIQTSVPNDRSQELAEAICQAAIEQADPVQLSELLSNQVVDNVIAAEIADILALLAAQRGHASIIPVLADNGAQFGRPDFHRGGPPLMHAANNGHASTVAALLEVVIPCFCSSAACWVFMDNEPNKSCSSWSMQGNADIDDMDNAGQTALMVAVFSGMKASVHLMLDFVSPAVLTRQFIL